MSGAESKTTLSDKAVQLIQQMKRNPDVMPPYNEELMRACITGIQDLYKQCHETHNMFRAGESSQSALQLISQRHDVIKFVIRCCSAYTYERSQRIKSYRWKYGAALPTSIRKNLSEAETEFFNEYSSSLAEFQVGMAESGIDLMSCTHPPNDLYLVVRVLEDYGEFETSDGNLLMLTKSTIHSLPRQDCEMLIRQGILELAN